MKREPNSSDQQWYDRAIEIGALSPEKDEWNYAAHYEYQGKVGFFHKFTDSWDETNATVLWICFEAKLFQFDTGEISWVGRSKN